MTPIRAENVDRYPPEWEEISRRIRFTRAGGRCECVGECGAIHPAGRCNALHGSRAASGSTVILTTAHRDHIPEHCADENLFAACQACHLAYDARHHAETRLRRMEESGQTTFFEHRSGLR